MNLVKVRDLINQLQKSIECSICLDALNDPVETKYDICLSVTIAYCLNFKY